MIEHLEELYRTEAAERQKEKVNPFRASSMGHCIRQGGFDLLGLKGQPLQPRRVAVFKHGNLIHEVLTADLAEALGWRFVDGLAFKDNFVEIDGAKINYHLDGAFQHTASCTCSHKPQWVKDHVRSCPAIQPASIGIAEIKSMADFSFNRATKGEIDHEYLCQAWVYFHATDFNPVVFIAYRKETSAMVEIVFDRNASEKAVTQRFNQDPIAVAKEGPLLVTEIRTPFDASVEEYVRQRIRYLKQVRTLIEDDVAPATIEEIVRLEVPGVMKVEDEIENIQGNAQVQARAKKLGVSVAKATQNGSWWKLPTGRRILGFPCAGYCAHMYRCFPEAKMEMAKDRPMWVV